MISVEFCAEVKGWRRYKKAKKYGQKFQRLSTAHKRYRRQTDLRQQRPERNTVTFGYIVFWLLKCQILGQATQAGFPTEANYTTHYSCVEGQQRR